MSHAKVDQAIQSFFRSPRVDRYQFAKSMVSNSDNYDPAASKVVALESRLSTGGKCVFDDVKQIESSFQICPRLHYIQARVCKLRGETDKHRTAVQRLQLCLRAISQTGDGTKRSPFQITFLTDTDDLVRAFGEKVRCQQLVASPDGYRDVLTAHSGVEFWFDVEPLLERTSSEAAAESHNVASGIVN